MLKLGDSSSPGYTVDRVVWLVPTHVPRFGVCKSMLESLRKFSSGIESAIVLSFHSEVEQFSKSGCVADILIVLEDYFATQEIKEFIDRKSIINVKKLFALKLLFAQGDVARVVVSDDEVTIVRELDSSRILSYETKYDFHKVSNPYLRQVIAAPLSLMTDEFDRTAAQDFFEADGWYGWFSDLPIYEREFMDSFFRRYSLESQSGFSNLVFESFDWIMYAYSKFLDCGGEKFNKLSWPPVPHSASWFEMGYHSRVGRKLLSQYYSAPGSLWVSDPVLLGANPRAVAVFNTDRNYRNLQWWQAIPRKGYTHLRAVMGKFLGRS